MQEHRYDVVIIGAGGAGMRAAIEAPAAQEQTVWRINLHVQPERPRACARRGAARPIGIGTLPGGPHLGAVSNMGQWLQHIRPQQAG